ncbi:MAG TPA: NRDE family protein [Bacteroidia bacterium]|nr:NRDE family protein [Bacteroidia bacterium]
MCTVTYLPLGNISFILTSNRDEGKFRKIALPPAKYNIYDTNVYFPKDADANGTWFAAAESKFTLCILNGAFAPHKHNPPYKLSRGLMLLDFFKYRNVQDFQTQYDFKGIEPFTLLIFEQGADITIHELRWDGNKIYASGKDASVPQIWSSAQLYTTEVIEQREEWFAEWLKAKNEFTTDNIIHFHKTGGNGNATTDLLMNRDGKVFTVSITSVKRLEQEGIMLYEDMILKTGITETRIG